MGTPPQHGRGDWINQVSDNCIHWMNWLGGYSPTTNGDKLSGYICRLEGRETDEGAFLCSQDLRDLSMACYEMALHLEMNMKNATEHKAKGG